MKKILYAAGTMEHIKSFHLPYIEALRKAGYEVFTMAKGSDADFNIPFVKKMLSVKNISCIKEIKKILRARNFDVIVLNTTLAAVCIRLALAGKKRPKVINFVHGYMFAKKTSSLKEKIFLLVEKYLYKRTDYIIVMNSEDYDSALKNKLCIGGVKSVRGMGAFVSPPRKTRESILKLSGCEGKYILCFVGELRDLKNQRMLICALPEIQIKIPNAVLWLIGEGEELNELRELAEQLEISDSVIFFGKRDNPCDYMRACDLYVTASKKEGLPFNVIEALGCGKTVLASDIKGHRDIIEEGKSGFLYAPFNTVEFVEKVKAVRDGELYISPNDAENRYRHFSRDEVFYETYLTIRELVEK